MAKLTTKKRDKLPEKDFAVKGRKYPIEDEKHARNALARVSQHGSSQEKAEVKRKVHAKYPDMDVQGLKKSYRKITRKHVSAKG